MQNRCMTDIDMSKERNKNDNNNVYTFESIKATNEMNVYMQILFDY